MSIYDNPGAGAHTYAVEMYLSDSYNGTESVFLGERYLTVTEIKP
jgi:hypothetical protein